MRRGPRAARQGIEAAPGTALPFRCAPQIFCALLYRLATRIGGAQVLPLCMPVLSRGEGGSKMFLHC
jgi:hypothetical protein